MLFSFSFKRPAAPALRVYIVNRDLSGNPITTIEAVFDDLESLQFL